MPDFGDWDVVQRETHRSLLNLLLGLLSGMSGAGADSVSEMTWTLRHRHTGEIRKVRAASERQAMETVSGWPA